jgi:hypothetical protein
LGCQSEADARVTTVQGLVASLGYAVEDDTVIALRDVTRHLLTDTEFELDPTLLVQAAGGSTMAPGFLDVLTRIAEPVTHELQAELADHSPALKSA